MAVQTNITKEVPSRDGSGHMVGFTPFNRNMTCYVVFHGRPGQFGITYMGNDEWSVVEVTRRNIIHDPVEWKFVAPYEKIDLEHAAFRAQWLADEHECKFVTKELFKWTI